MNVPPGSEPERPDDDARVDPGDLGTRATHRRPRRRLPGRRPRRCCPPRAARTLTSGGASTASATTTTDSSGTVRRTGQRLGTQSDISAR